MTRASPRLLLGDRLGLPVSNRPRRRTAVGVDVSPLGLVLLVAGGVLYSVGVLFYLGSGSRTSSRSGTAS